jgi:nucleoporin p58/p45
MSFGTPKPSGFNFGAPAASNPSTGFSLPSATQPQQQQTSFGFGTPTATVQPQPQQPAPTGLSFGTPAATTNPLQSALSFSTPGTAQPQSTGFAFGQPAMTATTAPASTPSLSFGLPSTTLQTQSQPATGFAFGAQAQTTTVTSSAAPTLSFGLPAATASTAAPSLTLNPLTTTTPSTGLSFGQPAAAAAPLFGAPQPAQQPSSLLSSLTSQPITSSLAGAAPPQSVGLGGLDMNTTQPKAQEGKNESTKVKETQVPKEIIQTVDDFKAYVKQQKTLSSDIIRTTDRKLKSVTEETQRLNCSVQDVSNNVDNNKLAIKLLRSDTSRVIQHADMGQRTHETPSGLQFENIMPQIYFNELIHKYENDLLTLKHQVELTETHLQSLSNPQNFSAQDLKRGLHQIHESFIALAGRLQETHTRVESQKEQYLNLRKHLLRDSTNVFEVEPSAASPNTSKVQYGPNPFTSSMHGLNQSKQWSTAAPQQQTSQMPTGNTTSFFGNSSFNFKK